MPLTAERRGRISVGLLTRNPLVADHLRILLKSDAAFRVFGEDEIPEKAPTGHKAVSVFVIDRGSLLQPLSKSLCAIRLRFAPARLLVLDQPQPLSELLSLLILGVHGFVAYPDASEELAVAIRRLHEGHLWFEPDILERYIAYAHGVERVRQTDGGLLTQRERHILELLQRRLANKEIATILHISENTVKFHLSNIYSKLGVHDRNSVLEFARERLLSGSLASEAS